MALRRSVRIQFQPRSGRQTRLTNPDPVFAPGARAARIAFPPLPLAPAAGPAGCQFIVAWSLGHAEKSGAAPQAYNERTQQCDAARRLVAARLGKPEDTAYPALLAAASVEELL